MKKKRLIGIILLVILLVIVAAAVFIGIRFRNTAGVVFDWDNIVSFVNSKRYAAEDIEAKMKDNKTKMEKIADESPHINIRGDLTPEEKTALNEGKITREDAVGIITGQSTLEEVLAGKAEAPPGNTPASTEPPGQNPPPADTPADNPAPTEPPEDKPLSAEPSQEDAEPKDRASEIIAELYVIQTEFLARLEGIGDSAYADYKATHYDRSKVTSIVDSYLGTVSALEAECDNKVKALLEELKTELEKVGGDQNIVKEVRNFYYNEKSLKKSYYLNKMYDEDYK